MSSLKKIIPGKLVRLIKMASLESRIRVRVGGQLTQVFSVLVGLNLGDTLSPLVFNLFLEHVLQRMLRLNGGIKLGNESLKAIGPQMI